MLTNEAEEMTLRDVILEVEVTEKRRRPWLLPIIANPRKYVGAHPWNTSQTKVLDNALIGLMCAIGDGVAIKGYQSCPPQRASHRVGKMRSPHACGASKACVRFWSACLEPRRGTGASQPISKRKWLGT